MTELPPIPSPRLLAIPRRVLAHEQAVAIGKALDDFIDNGTVRLAIFAEPVDLYQLIAGRWEHVGPSSPSELNLNGGRLDVDPKPE